MSNDKSTRKDADRAMADEIESIAQNDAGIVAKLEKGLVNTAVQLAANSSLFLEQYPRGSRIAARVAAVKSLKESYGTPALWRVVNGTDSEKKNALLGRTNTPTHIRHALIEQVKRKTLTPAVPAVIVTDLNNDTSYVAFSPEDCRCEADKEGFAFALESPENNCSVGKTVFEAVGNIVQVKRVGVPATKRTIRA